MLRLALALLLATAVTAPAAAQTDIDVLYIQKTPVLNYNSANGGWPLPGSTVTWNAKVKNWGSTTIPSLTCEWWLDGTKVQTDAVTNLAAGETRNVTYQWTWQQNPHTLEFRADTTGAVTETTEQNNNYSITTNALTIGSWVEQGVYDWFHAHQIELGDGANSFEDWCYRMTKRWNELFSLAVWPVSPNGIIDRVRIDKVVLVPNGSLPLSGGLATNNPDRYDKTVDLMWGHPYKAADCAPGGFWQVSSTGPFFIDYGEIHELNHARYIVDHYGFDVSQDATNPNVLVTNAAGTVVAGTSQMPYAAWNVCYYNKAQDIMGGASYFGEYAAGAWNRKAGIRGPYGNQNSPSDIGVYLNDLPQNNYFRFVDNSGAPIVGATIYIYRATGVSGAWYGKYFDNTPDITATTDSNGTVNLGRCPFSASGTVTSTYGLSNATFIIRVVNTNGQEYFTFGEVSDFGIQYWKGNTQNAYYTVPIPWGATNTATPVGANQWKQEIYNSKTLTNLADVKALDSNNVGGFALLMGDRPVSPGVSKDNFSCRFTRDVFFNKGSYKFIMNTDDGGRLYIDGVNYIDHWVDGGAVPQSAVVTFDSCGVRTVRMDYYESSAVAIATLAICPPLDTVPGPDDWKMEIYNSTNLTNLSEVAACPASTDGGFSLDWGDRGPGPRTGGDGFSVRFSRTFAFAGGSYRFTTTSDDAVRLYVDGQLKIDNWTAHSAAVDTVDLTLSPGDHAVVVETYDASGPARIGLTIDHLAPDFDVRFISRTPRYDRYNVSYQYGIDPNEPETGRPYLTPEEQAKKRWPSPGETVTYTAHVRNIGVSAASCDYKWYFDGVEVSAGTSPVIAPGEEFTATYSRPWDSEQRAHLIKFRADPAGQVAETREDNNAIEDATNALSVRLHVWQSLYDWFAAGARNYSDVDSFDDWAQRNIARLNGMFASAIYPSTPQGVPERVRIDEIVIESDGAADPDPSGTHAPADWPWDCRYGFTNDLLGSGNYFVTNPARLSDYDPALLAALGRQLGLIDTGAFNIDKSGNAVQNTVGHMGSTVNASLVDGAPFLSEHEAGALMSNLHKRRGYVGDYLYDLPSVVRMRVLDAYRRPLGGARVRIYQEYPGRTIPAVLRFDLTADANGYLTLPDRSCFGSITTATGHTLRDNPFGLISTTGENGVFFAQITGGTQTDYQFIEIARLNAAAWSGYGDGFDYELQANIVPEGRPISTDLYCVRMSSPTLGYAVGTSGRILKYDGTGWAALTSPTSQALYGVDISPDGGTAVVCGNMGSVFVNSGSGWVDRKPPTSAAIYSVAVLNASTILVGGNNAELYRSTDSGAHWSKITASQTSQGAIRGIRFRDSLRGILIPAKPPVYYTSDGGLTWIAASGVPPDLSTLFDCALPESGPAWLAISQGSIYTSANGGALWAGCVDFGSSVPWYGIDIDSAGSGWAVSRYHGTYNTSVIERFESGRWCGAPVCTSGNYNSINDVALTPAGDAWAVGRGGLIIRLADTWAGRSAMCDSLEALRALPDGTQVTLTSAAGLHVSAVFPECVYLEKSDRTSALKVYATSGGVLGAPASVVGILGTENGERVIRSGGVTCGTGSQPILPLATLSRSIGGLPNWTGTPALALLVRIAGRVTNTGAGWITVDDGSGLIASDGFAGVKVLCDTFTPPAAEFVSVTGVATTELVDGQLYRVVRARGVADVTAE